MKVKLLNTERLVLIPYTIQLCEQIRMNNYIGLNNLGFKRAIGWPDEDVLDTIPRIIINLQKVNSPTGFESWMVIKKNTSEVIGDIGFKGFNTLDGTIDLGYGIIREERRNGYAEEAAKRLILWALSNKKVKAITASCLRNNQGSIHLLEKLKFCEIKMDHSSIYWILKNESFS